MKRLFLDRFIAFSIDSFLLAIIAAGVNHLLKPFFVLNNAPLGIAIIIILYSCKDLAFRNASIGKMLMGLEIYDDKWCRPSPIILIKRFFWLNFEGTILAWKAVYVDGDYGRIFNAEYRRLKTRVVSKNTVAKLRSLATTENGLDVEKMSRLYDEAIGE